MNVIHMKFVCGYGLSSSAIARYGFSTHGFSHVAPMLSDGSFIDARSDTITVGGQAIPPGVQHRPPDYEEWKRWSVVEFRVKPEQRTGFYGFLERQVREGAPYDEKAILGIILGLALHGKGHFICSALGFDVMRHISIAHQSPVPDYEVSPDVLFALATSGWGGRVTAAKYG